VCSDIVDYELKTEYDSVEATPDKEIEDFVFLQGKYAPDFQGVTGFDLLNKLVTLIVTVFVVIIAINDNKNVFHYLIN